MEDNKKPQENKMGVMPVNKLLITMALPVMASMLVQALYNIVDSIFVSRICEDALTAVSMAFPAQNLMIGVASGIGVGTNAMLSRSLGEKKGEEADRYAMNGLFLILCGYILFLIFGITMTRKFYEMQGASAEITQFGYDYLSVILILSFGLFFQVILERLLQSTGKTIYSMYTQGTGAIINIILDPIMIFGLCGFPKMGIKGAALATVTGQVIAAVMGLYFNVKKNTEIHFYLKGFKPSMHKIGTILAIGVPSVIMMAIGSVMNFSVNKILVTFTSTAVAVFGVYFKLQSFAFMPVFGLNNGMVPIVAYNYGARKPDRMMQTLKLAAIYATGILIVGLIVAQLFPAQLLSIFNASEEMIIIGVPALRRISLSFFFAGFCIVSGTFFQALGASIYSTMVSFLRQLVILVPLAYILSLTGRVEVVWFAWPAAELMSLAATLFFLKRIIDKKVKPLREAV